MFNKEEMRVLLDRMEQVEERIGNLEKSLARFLDNQTKFNESQVGINNNIRNLFFKWRELWR